MYTDIELFAGAGGLALGFENAGLHHKCLVEMDNSCILTLNKNRPEWKVIHENIENVDFSNMVADVVSGGFPCQPFSYNGKQLGFKDTRGTLFFEFARCVKEVKPKICIAENVQGLVNHDNGRTLKTMIGVLENLGYNVQYKVLNANDFGVAQSRKRIFLIGTQKDIYFEYPKEQRYKPTLRDALKDVPLSEGQSYPDKTKKVLDMVPQGGCWVDLPNDVAKEYMGKAYYSNGGVRGAARRMAWDAPSLTLLTSPCQKTSERCHPDETRPFTIREYARIQSFPDDWEFMGSMSAQYKQIGNAVPVKLAEAIGKQIIKALDGQTPKQDVQTKLF